MIGANEGGILMDETLGKRISANRKRIGLTQDKLAEQLGVTAQAVSKWENDQACPDITTLPKLAEIFGITTDALLGVEKAPVLQAEVVEEEDASEKDGVHIQNGNWEFHWDGGRKNRLCFALWVLLTGVLLLLSKCFHWDVTLWNIAWPSGLLLYGLWGLFPKLSFFRLGCALFGLYWLLEHLNLPILDLGSEFLLPVCILLFGISLLADAFRKNKKPTFQIHRRGSIHRKTKKVCRNTTDSFDCSLSFGDVRHDVDVPLLRSGNANLSFGEMTIDLRPCDAIATDCEIKANCAFGELRFLVPKEYRVITENHSALASLNVKGEPDPAPEGYIQLDANISFGEITVQYI